MNGSLLGYGGGMAGHGKPPPRRVTVRFSPALHGLIERSAQAEGVTFAQYMREAAIMRAAWERAREQSGDTADAVREGYAQVRADWIAMGGPSWTDEG